LPSKPLASQEAFSLTGVPRRLGEAIFLEVFDEY
jgi:hypothetical protein